ncbi:MAG: hypothetical protein LBJ67_14180, partial [Planctomycetaceae bacterium]|nr:hypothetical protein [Planctomycetaceae bacterium]
AENLANPAIAKPSSDLSPHKPPEIVQGKSLGGVELFLNQLKSHSTFWRGIASRLARRRIARGAFDVVSDCSSCMIFFFLLFGVEVDWNILIPASNNCSFMPKNMSGSQRRFELVHQVKECLRPLIHVQTEVSFQSNKSFRYKLLIF